MGHHPGLPTGASVAQGGTATDRMSFIVVWSASANAACSASSPPRLNDSGLDPRQLELTESIIMQDVDQALGTMEELEELGVQLSIDDCAPAIRA